MKLGHAGACQFGDCLRRGRERTIAYYPAPDKRVTLCPSVCDQHYRQMRKVDGPEWRWLTTLRLDLNRWSFVHTLARKGKKMSPIRSRAALDTLVAGSGTHSGLTRVPANVRGGVRRNGQVRIWQLFRYGGRSQSISGSVSVWNSGILKAARAFMLDLESRLANRVQLTTDGYHVYLNAVEEAFGGGID